MEIISIANYPDMVQTLQPGTPEYDRVIRELKKLKFPIDYEGHKGEDRIIAVSYDQKGFALFRVLAEYPSSGKEDDVDEIVLKFDTTAK